MPNGDGLPFFPLQDFGPLMKGMVIGGMGIVHVFLAQFAIGGGMLLCYFQWLAQSGRERSARLFLDGYFRVLVLVSFVLGALTGVGMWLTTIQVSPRTIGLMVEEFHWFWAVEWTFFCLEVAAGYAFYRSGARLSDRSRMKLLVLYSAAAWFSLFWVNGILSWQLTPGGWLESGSAWSGFFNASFWPSLLFRTVVAMTLAGLVAMIVINAVPAFSREDRRNLIRRASRFLLPMLAMPVLGLWYFAVMPEDSRAWAFGGSPAMTLFLGISTGASLLIGAFALFGLLFQHVYVNGATATLLLALAFGATAGGEFVREGVRKPYTVRGALYANSIEPQQVAALRARGSVTDDPYPLRNAAAYPTKQLDLGARVFRLQCSVCHTRSGANGLAHLAGAWPENLLRTNLANLQHLKTFMPPFAGNAEELEALVQLIRWDAAGQPQSWAVSGSASILARNHELLAAAGTEAGAAAPAARGTK